MVGAGILPAQERPAAEWVSSAPPTGSAPRRLTAKVRVEMVIVITCRQALSTAVIPSVSMGRLTTGAVRIPGVSNTSATAAAAPPPTNAAASVRTPAARSDEPFAAGAVEASPADPIITRVEAAAESSCALVADHASHMATTFGPLSSKTGLSVNKHEGKKKRSVLLATQHFVSLSRH